MRLRGLIVLAATAATLLTPADGLAASSANPQLLGTVGPDFEIRLNHPDGSRVTQIDPGTYDVVVRDLSEDHDFHLVGPGVNETTGVEQRATVTWTVTLREGRYTFVCDPHSSDLRGSFVVGNPPPVTTTPAPPAAKRLLLTVGPTAAITLRDAAGKQLRGALPAGAYTIVVRDRSKFHNVHLVGKGVNRKSGLAATGTLTWKVKLAAGTLRFFSDRSPTKVKGSIIVR